MASSCFAFAYGPNPGQVHDAVGRTRVGHEDAGIPAWTDPIPRGIRARHEPILSETNTQSAVSISLDRRKISP